MSELLSSPYSALFDRLIPPYLFHPQTASLLQKPNGFSSMSARIDQSMFLQMTQIVVQSSVRRKGFDMRADIDNLVFLSTATA